MNNFELDDQAKTMACSNTSYSLAKQLILLKQERDELAAFADCVLRDVNDWDAYELQEAAVSSGIIKPIETTEKCGEDCVCYRVVDDVSKPWMCYRRNFEFKQDEV